MQPTARQLRARRARRQQGSAYVQALVVGTMMIVMFGCAIMFGHAYDAKVRSGQKARELAWALGARGCPGGNSDVRTGGQAVAQNAQQEGGGDLSSRAASLFFRLSPHSEQSSSNDAQVPALFGGQRLRYQTITQSACNEEVDMSGDLLSIGAWALDAFGDLITGTGT